MAKETRMNELSVDLAIQRELAYREKVAKVRFHQDADFMKKLLPLQPSSIPRTSFVQVQVPSPSPSPSPSANPNSNVSGSSSLVQLPSSSQSSKSGSAPWGTPCSGQRQPQRQTPNLAVVLNPPYQVTCPNPMKRPSPAPSQFPRPMPGPAPRQSETGIKRQATNIHLKSLPPRQPRTSLNSCIVVDQVGNFFCKACQVPCSGALPLKQHLKGHKHKSKMKWLQLNKKDGGEIRDQSPSCDLCQIWCTDENTLELHLNGQKHRAKVQELEQGQQSFVGEKASKMPWCELCQIWCTNEESFRQHLEGQKHVARLKRGPMR